MKKKAAPAAIKKNIDTTQPLHLAGVDISAKVSGSGATLTTGAQPSLAPTTTEQQDMTTAGQRKINLIWEFTQAFIAVSVIATNLIVGATFALKQIPAGEYPGVLSSSLFLVIGFYFSRTNHAAIGGTGQKPAVGPYTGR